MYRNQPRWLLGCALRLILIAAVAALVVAQWKHEPLPLAAVVAVLALTVVKLRIVVLDFIGLRHGRKGLAVALVAWSSVLLLAAGAHAAVVYFTA